MKIDRDIMEQNSRVSLSLLSDAGYDLHEAPDAWWLLNSRKPKERAAIALPARTIYLYSVLDAAWPELTKTAKP